MHRSHSPFQVVALVSTIALFASLAVAHEEDPKATERHRPVFGPAWHEADGGVAMETFAASGVALKSWFPVNNFDQRGAVNTNANDCWGYVSPANHEYAIVGLSDGTGFVDITTPGASTIVGFIPGAESLWRNVKVYQHWCYAVSEGGGGIQVMDLANIDRGEITLVNTILTGGNSSTHTMMINTQTGYLYRMGGGSNGLRIYDLNPNPASPVFIAQWQDKYTHDGFVVNYDSGPYAGKEIYFACGGLNNGYVDTGIDILDVTSKSNIQVLSHVSYENAAYCHQAWITPDKTLIYINDEIDEANFGIFSVGRIFDVTDLSAPIFSGTYTTGLPTVDHNLYVRDDRLYCSNYKSGIQIFDITDQTSPVRVAWFDTYPDNDTGGYSGLWSNYPFFPSGTVIGSDIDRGLFVWRLEEPVATFVYPEGLLSWINPLGSSTLDVSITPAEDQSIADGTQLLYIMIGAGSPTAYPLAPLGDDLYRATFPSMDCGTSFTYWFSVTGNNGVETTDPPGGAPAIGALGESVNFTESFEAGTSGWAGGIPGDTATAGQWILADPVGSGAQPEDDHTPARGTQCWVTGNGSTGGGVGEADVDNGFTTLVSPNLNVTGLQDPIVSYWRWYSNNQGSNPGTDTMPVYISNDGGLMWVLLEEVTENTGVWVKKSFYVKDFVQPTSQVRLKFIARDDLPGSVVEAAIDDLTVSSYDCPVLVGDINGDGAVNAGDLGSLLGQWGGPGSADLNDDGIVDATDLALLLGNWQ